MLAAMDRAGIKRAIVWHVAQRESCPAAGNDRLAEAIAGEGRLVGCWSILPPQTGELAAPDEYFAAAAAAGVRAFRAMPGDHRYLLRSEAVGGLLERMVSARRPLILPVAGDGDWPAVYGLMAEFPELTVILAEMGCWGTDRYFRPLIERYANVYVETSGYVLDGGIEAFVADYGARQMLFGSGFPTHYHGPTMLAIAHAEIDPADRQAIAADNLRRIVEEART